MPLDEATVPGPPSDRTKVRRHAERGRYDRASVDGILAEGIIAHVGVGTEHGPVVLPMAYGRIGDTLYLHGAAGNAMLRAADGAPVCVTVTLLDGLVLARSAFSHSMNHRSVVVYGLGRTVLEPDEQRLALDAIVDHTVPGRSEVARRPTDEELRKTRVLAVALGEASAKVREGPPLDADDDLGWPVWAGVVPITTVRGEPLEDVRA
jgi:nitroimidazol reductase NimA-like FMN-containing flavoprotein (pyridoxamine 5'-phosphate oxidase superfamily)